MTRSKVKSRSHHDAAHLQPLTNVITKHQLPTRYEFRDIARTRLYRSRSLRKVKGQITVTPSPPNQCRYQVLTYYTLQFLRYSPDKLFPATRPPIRTPWVKTIPRQPFKGCGVKMHCPLNVYTAKYDTFIFLNVKYIFMKKNTGLKRVSPYILNYMYVAVTERQAKLNPSVFIW